jgi:glycosyltransferase involved in cell wall biosynthesis
MSNPLVSVICLCYNHEKFVKQAILSALNQTYSNVEVIVVNDASTDNSAAVVQELLTANPQLTFLNLERNVGNCKAFNIGFAQSKGDYIIDFAADDILLENRIQEGVNAFQSAGNEYGVQFSDAELIDEEGGKLGLHSYKYPHDSIPSGDIYLQLIKRYFICAPTMLIKREVLSHLKGYDETLAYEDFDFWIRSARKFKYIYLPQALVQRRILHNSMKNDQFKKGSNQLRATYKVCEKINRLNSSDEENRALRLRLRYEFKICLKLFEVGLAIKYLRLLMSV